MQEATPIQESWNKKRLIIFSLFLVILLGTIFKIFVLDKNKTPVYNAIISGKNSGKVEGISTEDNQTVEQKASLPVQSIVENRLNEIRREVSKLNVSEIASSSPQVQKVLNDLKALENYPKNQAKEACLNLCNNF